MFHERETRHNMLYSKSGHGHLCKASHCHCNINVNTVEITVFCALGGNYWEAFKLLSTELVMWVFMHCRGSLTLPVCSPRFSGGSCDTGGQGLMCSFGYLWYLLPAHRVLSFVTEERWQPIDECACGSATHRDKPLLNWNAYFISWLKYLRPKKQ